ncbi:MAG: MipA/OmpV family protein [Alphaproteobacteria bacterium]|nr:MipA/OmpV family protein [Alphaproteobacteria bacterium]
MQRVFAAACVLVATVPSSAAVEGQSPWQGYGSVGVGLLPDFEGARTYETLPYVEGRLNYDNYYVRIEGSEVRFNVVDDDSFHAGPLVGFRRGRHDMDNSPVSLLRHYDDTETAGGFVEYEHVADDPRSGETVTLLAEDAIVGAASGWTATLRATIRRPVEFVDPGLIATVEGDIGWASTSYMRTGFGIDPAYAAASGLPAFAPKSGFEVAGVAFSLDQFLSRHWSVGLDLHYGRLLGDAAASPVTAIAGSANQYFAGFTVGYVL